MKTKLQYSLIGLMITITSVFVNAQDVINFDVNSKLQKINSLETWSGVNMHHVKMSPTPSDLIIDINSHNYTMGLKSDVEQINDNSDPNVTDFSKFTPKLSGVAGFPMASYFPYIREYKRLRDSMRVKNPALKPFSLGLNPTTGAYDRSLPTWIRSTAPGTGLLDSNKYAEFAENIYYQCKTYKDSTGVDVTIIDPVDFSNTSNVITATNLCKLIGTIGSYLETRGFTPALSIGSGLRLTATYSNQALLFNYISKVFNDPIAKKYVKNVNVDYDLLYGAASDAFFNRMVDSSKKYGFDITTALSFMNANTKTWGWAGNGMSLAKNLPKMLNTAKANKIMLWYHTNFEVVYAVGMFYDTIGNGMASLDDPIRKTTARKTEAFYLMRHLFKHTNPGSTYVLTSSSTNANILQAVVYDTITQKTTIFLVNKGTGAYTAKLSYGSYSPGTYDVYRCSATEIDVRLASINPTDNIILPAQSATILTTDIFTPDTQIPTVPTALTSSNITSNGFTLSWTASTDNVGIASYEIFKNGISSGTSITPSFNVTGLTVSTSYLMTVKAKDVAGNVSAASTVLNVTTTTLADIQAPTVPTTLTSSAITTTGFIVSWTASTDNIGVTGYEVFKDGVSLGIITTTSMNVSGLTANITYAITVRARDAASNWSAQSTALNVLTSDIPNSINNPSEDGVMVYPNPANDIINISADDIIQSLNITDVTGKMVLIINNINDASSVLNIESLSKGYYLITVKTKSGSCKTIHFVKE